MKTHQFKPIDSGYSVTDAKKVTFTLINDKIRFLNSQIYSLKERFGRDTSHFENRVELLKAEKDLLIQMLVDLEEDDSLIDIHCALNFSINRNASVA